MIKINYKQFIHDRVWFGWWYAHFSHTGEGEWRHDTTPYFRFKVMTLKKAQNAAL